MSIHKPVLHRSTTTTNTPNFATSKTTLRNSTTSWSILVDPCWIRIGLMSIYCRARLIASLIQEISCIFRPIFKGYASKNWENSNRCLAWKMTLMFNWKRNYHISWNLQRRGWRGFFIMLNFSLVSFSKRIKSFPQRQPMITVISFIGIIGTTKMI